MAREYEEEEYDEDEYEEEEEEYTGIIGMIKALLHDQEKEPHVHLGILLIVTFIVAVIVKVAGL